uniref:Uncharacterized protein n=1 Tax=Sphenodon punctatus TaxID=8508 RepID=A0A8D0L271_SPHPU
MRQEELCTDDTAKADQVVNLMEVSQSDTASAQAEFQEHQKNEQLVASDKTCRHVEEVELEEESPLAPILPTDNSDSSSPDKRGDATMRQEELCTDDTAKADHVVNLMEVSQSDMASAQAEFPEQQENEQPAASDKTRRHVDEVELEEESPLDLIIPTENSDSSSPDKHGDATMRQEELCTDDTAKANQVVNLMEVSQSDTAPAQAEFPEDQENQQPVASDKTHRHVEEEELEEESPLDPVLPNKNLDSSSPDKHGGATMRQEELCTNDTAKANHVLNVMEVSQSDTASAQAKLPEDQENEQPVESDKTHRHVEEEELEEESPLDSIIHNKNSDSSSPDKRGDATMRQEELCTDDTAKANQVLNLMEVKSDTAPAQAELPEDQENEQPAASDKTHRHAEEEELEEESPLDPIIPTDHSSCSSDKRGDATVRQEELCTADTAKANQVLNVMEVSQSNTASVQAEFPENQENEQPGVSDKTAISEERQETDCLPLHAEDKASDHSGVDEPLHLHEADLLEEHGESTEQESPCSEMRDLHDSLGNADQEEEDFNGENMVLEPIDLALSESNDADMEHQELDQDPVDGVFPKETCVHGEGEEAGVYNFGSPCDSVLNLRLSPPGSPIHQTSSKEVTKSSETLPEDQEDTVLPANETISLTQTKRGPISEKPTASSIVDDVSRFWVAEQTDKDSLFLEHELPLTEMNTLLKNDEGKEPTLCDEFNRETANPAENVASVSEGEEPSEACGESSVWELAELQNDKTSEERNMCADSQPSVPAITSEELPASVRTPTELYLSGDSTENVRIEGTEAIVEQCTEFASGAVGTNMDFESMMYESLSGDSDPEYLRGTVTATHLGGEFGSPCSRGSVDTTEIAGTNYEYVQSSENEGRPRNEWDCLEAENRFSVVARDLPACGWPPWLRKDSKSAPPAVSIDKDRGTLQDYINFTVTKKHKGKTRTLQSSKRHDYFTERSLTMPFKVFDDLTQNTVDLECLRFNHKLKQEIRSRKPQLSTSNSIFPKEFLQQGITETLSSRKAPEAPTLNTSSRSRSPLLVTIVNSSSRPHTSHCYSRRTRQTDFVEPTVYAPPQEKRNLERNTAKIKSQRREEASFHLNKLKYDSKLHDVRGDISVIMNEFSELNKVMRLNDSHLSKEVGEPSATSDETADQGKRGARLPKRTTSYENVITDLCKTFRFRLKSVAKEACKNTFLFYLVETEDDPFFARTKSLLKKGHTEIEPSNFCKTNHLEKDRLMVVIRNEDIYSHIHKIPSLLSLKHFPNVLFAGVDSPEDVLDHTYQELFHAGGFVVSDDQVLETATLGQLKGIVQVLERLNARGRWRWFLHYKECKKLKEEIRVDSAAHKKYAIVKSCQGDNLLDVLHYHQCDSKSSPKSEHLNCVLNLQVQHIHSRFAVYLTETPSGSREALESKGILVMDIDTFVASGQDVATPFRGSYWW